MNFQSIERTVVEHYIIHYNPLIIDIINNSHPIIKYPIYVINLKHDVFRRSYIQFIMKNYALNYKLVIVDAVTKDTVQVLNDGQKKSLLPGEIGCCLSQLWCIDDAIKRDYSHFLIFEDDIIFRSDFLTSFIATNPETFDMLMLGACDFHIRANVKTIDNGIYFPVANVCGSHASFYALKFAKKLLAHKLDNFGSFDTNFAPLYETNRVGVCFPNLVICELSTTSIQHNFSPLFPKRYAVYIKQCFMNHIEYAEYDMFLIVFLKFIVATSRELVLNDKTTVQKLVYRFNCINKLRLYNTLAFMPYSLDDIREMIGNVDDDLCR